MAGPLPGAEREVQELASQFPGAKRFFNAEANETNFRASALQADVTSTIGHATRMPSWCSAEAR